MATLLNCCGCASLKTGTMVIGSLNLGVSVIGILASMDYLADLKVWTSTYSSSSSLCNHNHNFSQTGHFFQQSSKAGVKMSGWTGIPMLKVMMVIFFFFSSKN